MKAVPFKIDAKILAVAPWAGGKRRLAPRIVELLGPHHFYIEPFVGGCAILPQKSRCEREYINDANPAVVNVIQCVRDFPVSLQGAVDGIPFNRELFAEAMTYADANSDGPRAAVAQLVVWWMGPNGLAGTDGKPWFAQRHTKTGGSPLVRWNSFRRSIPALSGRLKGVTVTCQDFARVIDPRSHDAPGIAIYVDPPYFAKKFKYTHDFAAVDHVALAHRLNSFRRSRVVVSYYDSPLIPALYPADRWERHEVPVSKASANARTGATKTAATELILVNRT